MEALLIYTTIKKNLLLFFLNEYELAYFETGEFSYLLRLGFQKLTLYERLNTV